MNSPAAPDCLCPRLTREQFASLIPHSGRMCLIDSVEYWDERSIDCLSTTHLDKSNPLRGNGELSPIHLLEYGAQAMAIHGGLLQNSAMSGRLAAFRNVRLYVETARDSGAPIRIRAVAAAISAQVAVYYFAVSEPDGSTLCEARATVINH